MPGTLLSKHNASAPAPDSDVGKEIMKTQTGQAPEQNTFFKRWLTLPGNEIYAELYTQNKLPTMNNRTFNAGPPVPGTDEGNEPVMGAGTEQRPLGVVEELPATYDRQWRSPLHFLREQHPGVQIMPWPTLVITLVAPNNTVRRVTLPNNTQLIRLSGTTNFLASQQRFVLPLASSLIDLPDDINLTTGPLNVSASSEEYWDVTSMSEIFVGFRADGAIISVSCWTSFSPRV